MAKTLLLGAVAYDPKVVTIWEGFKRFFEERGLPFDVLLYTNYERQVLGLLAGEIDVAWNSPLAWIEAERAASLTGREARAVAMRDSDRDLTSVIVVRQESEIRSLKDLAGTTISLGASDSPQAALIPLEHLARHGIHAETDFALRWNDILVGKHGDHIGGEREAARDLLDGRAEAACMIDANHLAFAQDGTLPAGSTRVLSQTEPYDHCNFTILVGASADQRGGADEPIDRFRNLLLSMSYEDPEVRPLLDMEGLKSWMPGRVSGYELLNSAVDRFGTLRSWLGSLRAA